MLDVEKFISGLHDYMERALKPLAARVAALEAAPPPERGEKGDQGEKGDPGADGPQGVAGRDGRDGAPGRDGADGADGRDGADGKDGADGLGFDDLSVEHDGERGFTIVFERDGVAKRFPFRIPAVIDRGVYGEKEYEQGDGVTWGGSYWIAKCDNPDGKPGLSDGWRLAVKKGRDGKDGK